MAKLGMRIKQKLNYTAVFHYNLKRYIAQSMITKSKFSITILSLKRIRA